MKYQILKKQLYAYTTKLQNEGIGLVVIKVSPAQIDCLKLGINGFNTNQSMSRDKLLLLLDNEKLELVEHLPSFVFNPLEKNYLTNEEKEL